MRPLFTPLLLVGFLACDGESTEAAPRRRAPASSATTPGGTLSASRMASPPVVVNGVRLAPQTLASLERTYGMRLPAGAFWYDRVSGAWGVEGGPTLGFTRAGIDVGGPLRADASRGRTGVFVNGRELDVTDLVGLQQLVGSAIQPGRYFVDAFGNAGYEGGPAIVNLLLAARARGGGGAYQRRTSGGYIGGDGHSSYFFDPKSGASVMTGD